MTIHDSRKRGDLHDTSTYEPISPWSDALLQRAYDLMERHAWNPYATLRYMGQLQERDRLRRFLDSLPDDEDDGGGEEVEV